MFRASASDAIDGAAEQPRPFGRFRPHTADLPSAERAPEPRVEDGAPPDVQPLDSTKSFVGPNGTYYDERWRWMEWRDRQHSWNWAAATSFGGWFAYRRLPWMAALCVAWLGLLVLLAINGVHLRLLLFAQLGAAVLLGLYGNTLYRLRFRRAASRVAEEQTEHRARIAALSRAGGIDRVSVWLLAVATIAVILLVVWLGAPDDGVQIAF